MFDSIPQQKLAEFRADQLRSVVHRCVERKTKKANTSQKTAIVAAAVVDHISINSGHLKGHQASLRKSCTSLFAKFARTWCHSFPGHIHGVNGAAVGTGRVCSQLAHWRSNLLMSLSIASIVIATQQVLRTTQWNMCEKLCVYVLFCAIWWSRKPQCQMLGACAEGRLQWLHPRQWAAPQLHVPCNCESNWINHHNCRHPNQFFLEDSSRIWHSSGQSLSTVLCSDMCGENGPSSCNCDT